MQKQIELSADAIKYKRSWKQFSDDRFRDKRGQFGNDKNVDYAAIDLEKPSLINAEYELPLGKYTFGITFDWGINGLSFSARIPAPKNSYAINKTINELKKDSANYDSKIMDVINYTLQSLDAFDTELKLDEIKVKEFYWKGPEAGVSLNAEVMGVGGGIHAQAASIGMILEISSLGELEVELGAGVGISTGVRTIQSKKGQRGKQREVSIRALGVKVKLRSGSVVSPQKEVIVKKKKAAEDFVNKNPKLKNKEENIKKDDINILLDETVIQLKENFKDDAQVLKYTKEYQQAVEKPKAFAEFEKKLVSHIETQNKIMEFTRVASETSYFLSEVAVLTRNKDIARISAGINAGLQAFSGLQKVANTIATITQSGMSVTAGGALLGSFGTILGAFNTIGNLFGNNNDGLNEALEAIYSALQVIDRKIDVVIEKLDALAEHVDILHRDMFMLHRESLRVTLTAIHTVSVQLEKTHSNISQKIDRLQQYIDSYLKHLTDKGILETLNEIKISQKMVLLDPSNFAKKMSQIYVWLTTTAALYAVAEGDGDTNKGIANFLTSSGEEGISIGLFQNLAIEHKALVESEKVITINTQRWFYVLEVYLMMFEIGKEFFEKVALTEPQVLERYKNNINQVLEIAQNNFSLIKKIAASDSLWEKLASNYQQHFDDIKNIIEHEKKIEIVKDFVSYDLTQNDTEIEDALWHPSSLEIKKILKKQIVEKFSYFNQRRETPITFSNGVRYAIDLVPRALGNQHNLSDEQIDLMLKGLNKSEINNILLALTEKDAKIKVQYDALEIWYEQLHPNRNRGLWLVRETSILIKISISSTLENLENIKFYKTFFTNNNTGSRLQWYGFDAYKHENSTQAGLYFDQLQLIGWPRFLNTVADSTIPSSYFKNKILTSRKKVISDLAISEKIEKAKVSYNQLIAFIKFVDPEGFKQANIPLVSNAIQSLNTTMLNISENVTATNIVEIYSISKGNTRSEYRSFGAVWQEELWPYMGEKLTDFTVSNFAQTLSEAVEENSLVDEFFMAIDALQATINNLDIKRRADEDEKRLQTETEFLHEQAVMLYQNEITAKIISHELQQAENDRFDLLSQNDWAMIENSEDVKVVRKHRTDFLRFPVVETEKSFNDTPKQQIIQYDFSKYPLKALCASPAAELREVQEMLVKLEKNNKLAFHSILNHAEAASPAPIYLAIAAGRIDIVELLLSYDAVIDMEKVKSALSNVMDKTVMQKLRALTQFYHKLNQEKTLKQTLNVGKTLSLLRAAAQYLNKYKNLAEAIVFIGETRVGKGTTANVIAGIEYELYSSDDGQDQLHTKKSSIIEWTDTSAHLGSHTVYPQISEPQKAINNAILVDMPGFDDTRGTPWDITLGVSTQKLGKIFVSIKALVLICDGSKIFSPNIKDIYRSFTKLGLMINHNKDLLANIVLVVNRVYPPKTQEQIAKRLSFFAVQEDFPFSEDAKFVLEYLSKNINQIMLTNIPDDNFRQQFIKEVTSMKSQSFSKLNLATFESNTNEFKSLLISIKEYENEVRELVGLLRHDFYKNQQAILEKIIVTIKDESLTNLSAAEVVTNLSEWQHALKKVHPLLQVVRDNLIQRIETLISALQLAIQNKREKKIITSDFLDEIKIALLQMDMLAKFNEDMITLMPETLTDHLDLSDENYCAGEYRVASTSNECALTGTCAQAGKIKFVSYQQLALMQVLQRWAGKLIKNWVNEINAQEESIVPYEISTKDDKNTYWIHRSPEIRFRRTTGKPIFGFDAYDEQGKLQGHVEFYAHPLLCKSEEGNRNNILMATGIFEQWAYYLRAEDIQETCTYVPPTFEEEYALVAYQGAVSGAQLGALRGFAHFVSDLYSQRGYSPYASFLIGKLCFYVCLLSLYVVNNLPVSTNYASDYLRVLLMAMQSVVSVFLLDVLLMSIETLSRHMGDALEVSGYQEVGSNVKQVGKIGTKYGLYAYQIYKQSVDPLPQIVGITSSIIAGQMTEKAVDMTLSKLKSLVEKNCFKPKNENNAFFPT